VPGARYITATFVAVMLIPGQVLIIPIYLLLSKVQLVGTHPGLMVVYIATALPFAIFFLSLSFKAIPSEVLEAAKIDGAGFFRTLWSVVLPMSVSSIATLAVLQFLGMWNELIFAYILLPDQELGLLTPLLARASGTSKFVSDQTVVSAGLLLTASVPLLLLAIASRYIMKGLSVGFSR
jgi:ABC-type glycerol-3-phosphate transport system permease component